MTEKEKLEEIAELDRREALFKEVQKINEEWEDLFFCTLKNYAMAEDEEEAIDEEWLKDFLFRTYDILKKVSPKPREDIDNWEISYWKDCVALYGYLKAFALFPSIMYNGILTLGLDAAKLVAKGMCESLPIANQSASVGGICVDMDGLGIPDEYFEENHDCNCVFLYNDDTCFTDIKNALLASGDY